MNSIIILGKSELNSIYGGNRCYCNNSIKRDGAVLIGSTDSRIVCSTGCTNKKYAFYHLAPDCTKICLGNCKNKCYLSIPALIGQVVDYDTGWAEACADTCEAECYCTDIYQTIK